MDLESVIEWRKSERKKYRILMHICGIQENGIGDLILQSRNRDANVENGHVDTAWWGRGSGVNWEVGIDLYILPRVK